MQLQFPKGSGIMKKIYTIGGIKMEEIKKLPLRSEVKKEDTWATEDMYVSDEAWEEELKTISEEDSYLASFRAYIQRSKAQVAAGINQG